MVPRRKWTAVGTGLELLAAVLMAVDPLFSIPVAIIGGGFIVWGFFPDQLRSWGAKLFGKWGKSNKYISLNEAARRTYEETEETSVAWFAEIPHADGNKAVLSWCAYALVGKNRQTPIYGKRPPSRIRRQISVDELKICRLDDDATMLLRQGKKDPEFVELEIKETDFLERLCEIKAWIIESDITEDNKLSALNEVQDSDLIIERPIVDMDGNRNAICSLVIKNLSTRRIEHCKLVCKRIVDDRGVVISEHDLIVGAQFEHQVFNDRYGVFPLSPSEDRKIEIARIGKPFPNQEFLLRANNKLRLTSQRNYELEFVLYGAADPFKASLRLQLNAENEPVFELKNERQG